jgi:flagellar hook-basal body complex protein FliE
MIAIGRAEVSMKFVVSLRNRALEAYQEIMRLQV